MSPPLPVVAAAAVPFPIAKFALTGMAKAVMLIYGAAGTVNAFVDEHIDLLKASSDPSISKVGSVLEGAKKGLLLGYAAPVVLIATGQLLLGHPFLAGGTVLTAATLTNPIAATCAAIGAIWFGWKALNNTEQEALLEKLSKGFELAIDVIRSVIEFALGQLKSMLSSKELKKLKDGLIEFARKLGRSLYAITGKLKDLLYSTVDEVQLRQATSPLMPVLKAMKPKKELEPLLVNVLKVSAEKAQGMTRTGMEREIAHQLSKAATYSLPYAKAPSYDDIVRMVARNLKLPSRAELRTEDLERAILFKVVERSLEKMDEKQREVLTQEVEKILRERGIDKKVSFDEVVKFTKFTAMDVGGTLGTALLTAPGLAGLIGLNALQYIVLQGVILSSGYFAGATALMGFGFGGAMLTVAGAAGPIGLGLAVVYTFYRISGPAYRKLIPAICVIAAKRVELDIKSPG